MRSLVVYESMWGNTEQVARAVAGGLEAGGPVLVLEVSSVKPHDLEGIGLLVVGGPTHAFSMSRKTTRDDAVNRGAPWTHAEVGIREWLEGLPESDTPVATFDTRIGKVRHMPGSAAKKAAKEVRQHHLGRVVATESFWVEDTEGPLFEGELERAAQWGRSLLGSVPSPAR